MVGGGDFDRRPLIRISEASAILGVSDVALRKWTDEGKIAAFITPGGHRRYSEEALQEFMSARKRAHGIEDMITELRATVPNHQEISETYRDSFPWAGKLTEENKERFAALGRRLLDLIVKYVSVPNQREETVERIQLVQREYAETLTQLDIPLADCLKAFLNHRRPVINSATELLKRRGVLDEPAVTVMPMLARVMDEALISLVAAYDQLQENAQTQKRMVQVE